jgi:ubiquinone/menaquinone biosynthesis C-methylase UbiE
MAQLRNGVWQVYSTIALKPQAKHPIPVGRRLAENVGYSRQRLDQAPDATVAAFAGVSNVSLFADLAPGATVLDLGCGSGLDSLIAAQRLGGTGRVIGVDFSATMLLRARHNAPPNAGQTPIHFVQSDAERLALADGAVDIALVNGIFNLNPARAAIFAELSRVVKPGGAVYAAEIVLRQALPEKILANETNWFA